MTNQLAIERRMHLGEQQNGGNDAGADQLQRFAVGCDGKEIRAGTALQLSRDALCAVTVGIGFHDCKKRRAMRFGMAACGFIICTDGGEINLRPRAGHTGIGVDHSVSNRSRHCFSANQRCASGV